MVCFFLPALHPSRMLSATVNTNLQTDMPDGQQQVHGTVMANFQEGKAEVQ